MDFEDPIWSERQCCALAWAAGLFEGEGSVTRSRGRPRATIKNNDRDVLEVFQSLLGGEIYGPYGPYKSQLGRNPFYIWVVEGSEEVDRLITRLQPWLSDRRLSQAVAALAGG